MKMTRILAMIFILSLAAVPAVHSYTYGFKGNPEDTPAGTPVTMEGGSVSAHYYDGNDYPRDLVNGNTVTEIVTAEYGMWAPQSNFSPDEVTTRGIPFYFLGVFQNTGNDTYNVRVSWEVLSSGDAVGWTTEFYKTMMDSPRGAWNSGDILVLPDNGHATVEITVTPAVTAEYSPDGSWSEVMLYVDAPDNYPLPGTLEGSVATVTYAYYYGVADNVPGGDPDNNLYGGFIMPITVEGMVTVQSPVIAMTRISTVDAPLAYTGDPHDAVPGSLVTIQMTLTNEGSGNAKTLVIADKVPENMVAYEFNTTSPPNVDWDGPYQEMGTFYDNFNFYWTSEASPDFSYDAPGWVYAGATYSGASSIDPSATFVKWQIDIPGREFQAGTRFHPQWTCYVR